MAGNVSPDQFAASVLKAVGAPVNHSNVAAFIGWSRAEGGDNWQRNNPLNTTESTGATRTINSDGVKAYGTPQAGVAATVKTLLNGKYGGIIGALKASNPGAVASAIGASPWGTSGSLAAQTIQAALGGKYNISSGATLPATPGTSLGKPTAAATQPVTTTSFDQARFNADQARYIAGSYLQSATDPYAKGQPKLVATGAASNPLLTSGALLTKAPDPAAYQTAHTVLQKLAGNTPLNQHPTAFSANLAKSGYTNPLPGANWERTDMGVDASMKPGATIRALGDSRVAAIYPNWYKGQPYVKLQLLSGPQQGKFYYVAEAINPTVRPGQTVRAGQTIGTYNPGGTGLELGWGTSGSKTEAQATTGYTEGQQTAAGKNFRNFLNGLGAGA